MLRSLRSFTFFAKECCVLCILLCSLQKNVAFFALFYVLKKRTHSSFGSHKSPKTREKKCKRTLRSLKEGKRMMRSERKRTQCPTLQIRVVRQAPTKNYIFESWMWNPLLTKMCGPGANLPFAPRSHNWFFGETI